MENSSKYEELFLKALETAKNAYVPYSQFRVGSALLLDDGSIVTGVNVENRSYGLTNCAERTAIFRAIADGKKNFTAIAIATPDADYPVGPCGACRQVISEFMKPDAPIIFGSSIDNYVETTVGIVYPFDSLRELQKK
ncbi:MAG: cytidine deaminase [Treponema sp.]